MKADSRPAGFIAGSLVGWRGLPPCLPCSASFCGKTRWPLGSCSPWITLPPAISRRQPPHPRLQGPQTTRRRSRGWTRSRFPAGSLQSPAAGLLQHGVDRHSAVQYLSDAPGLKLRAVGENPQVAYARAARPRSGRCSMRGRGGLRGACRRHFCALHQTRLGRPQGAEGTGSSRSPWSSSAGGTRSAGLGLPVFISTADGHLLPGLVPSICLDLSKRPLSASRFYPLAMSMAQNESVPGAGGEARASEPQRHRAFLSGMAPAALGRPFRPE